MNNNITKTQGFQPKVINGKKVVAVGYDEDEGKFVLDDKTVVDKDGKVIQ